MQYVLKTILISFVIIDFTINGTKCISIWIRFQSLHKTIKCNLWEQISTLCLHTLQQKVVKSIFDTFHAKTIMSFKFSCKDQHMALMKLKVFLHEIVGKTYNSINH